MSRRYERGENRRKHVGKLSGPQIVTDSDGETVGKCPARFPDVRKQELLDKAIPYITSPPYSEEFPKRLFIVDRDGTIYTAQTSNPGDSYHGYPYAGTMGKGLIAKLRTIAVRENCEKEFEQWCKSHIQRGSKPDI